LSPPDDPPATLDPLPGPPDGRIGGLFALEGNVVLYSEHPGMRRPAEAAGCAAVQSRIRAFSSCA